MAGVFDRIGTDDNIATEILIAAVCLVESGDVSQAAALNHINYRLQTPLNAAAQTDLQNIVTELSGKANDGEKALYLRKLKSIATAQEYTNASAFNDSTFRTMLNIS